MVAEYSLNISGMLLFPLGSLSHTSVLYYTILYVMVGFEEYGIGGTI